MTARQNSLAPRVWRMLLGATLIGILVATLVTRATTPRARRSPMARQAPLRELLRRGGEALPTYGAAPAFTLTDHHNNTLTREQLFGHVWIADFIFTRCAGQCPMMTSQMALLQRELPQAVRLISVSVDPSHDTPTVLAAYAARSDAREGWLFATGEPSAVTTLVREGFHLAVEDQADVTQEPILHSVRLVLVDQQGMIRGYYDSTDPEAIARLQLDAHALIQADPAS